MHEIDRGVYQHQCFIPYKDSVHKQSMSKTRATESRSSVCMDIKRSSSLEVNVSESSFKEKFGNKRLRSDQNTVDNSTYASTNDGKVTNNTSSGKFLDWLAECFWKCSLGCQELPTMK